MKKITLLTLIAFMITTFSISSCKKYEEGGRMSKKAANKNVVNKWAIDKFYQDGFDNSQTFIQTNYQINIKDDNTYNVMRFGNMQENGVWEFSSDLKFFNRTIQGTNKKLSCEIIKLTEDAFWFKVQEDNFPREYRMKIGE